MPGLFINYFLIGGFYLGICYAGNIGAIGGARDI